MDAKSTDVLTPHAFFMRYFLNQLINSDLSKISHISASRSKSSPGTRCVASLSAATSSAAPKPAAA